MASRDLVGRPLVPFFDSDDNVNDSLQLGDDEREEMDVDARVWDKELGYFVYPSEQQATVSQPVAIAETNRESRSNSGSKLLLTPSMMLSSNAPEHFNSNGNSVQANTDNTPARSSSAKQGSKQKSRSNNPARRRRDKDGSDDASRENAPTSKKGKNNGGNANSNGAQCGNNSNNQQSRNGKQKEQLSASGKWAWSAFQSSPDPAQLPMPPFLTKPSGGSSNGNAARASAAPPLPPTPPPPAQHVSAPIAPPLPPGPPPSQPPLPTGAPPEMTASPPMSIELSMTQDLWRMLNIGGG